MVGDVSEMEEIIRKNFLQSEVSKKEFYSLNPVQNDLRKKCEEQRLLIESLEKEIDKLRLTMQNENQNDEKDTAKIIKRLEIDLANTKAVNDVNEKATKEMK